LGPRQQCIAFFPEEMRVQKNRQNKALGKRD